MGNKVGGREGEAPVAAQQQVNKDCSVWNTFDCCTVCSGTTFAFVCLEPTCTTRASRDSVFLRTHHTLDHLRPSLCFSYNLIVMMCHYTSAAPFWDFHSSRTAMPQHYNMTNVTWGNLEQNYLLHFTFNIFSSIVVNREICWSSTFYFSLSKLTTMQPTQLVRE